MSWWHAYSRAVVFCTLHRSQRYTRLCPLISYFCYVVLYLPLSQSRSIYLFPPSLLSLLLFCHRRFRLPRPCDVFTSCPHHRIQTRTPGSLSNPSHRFNSDRVAIYCATLFWRRLKYFSIVKNPAVSFAAATEVYLHVPSVFIGGSCSVSRLATWVWNTPRDLPMRGMNTQVSTPNISTAWITAF